MITGIFFFTLRVAQTAIQLKNKYIMDCITRNCIFCTFYIAGCTTRNIKLFLNTLRVVQPAIQFFLNTLRVVQTAIYLEKKFCIAGCTTRNVFKKKLCYRLYNMLLWCNGDYHISFTINEDYFYLFLKVKMGIY